MSRTGNSPWLTYLLFQLERAHRPQTNLVAQNREIEGIREERNKQNRETKTELNKIRFDELSSTKAFNAQVRREVERRLNHADHGLEERRERYVADIRITLLPRMPIPFQLTRITRCGRGRISSSGRLVERNARSTDRCHAAESETHT